MANIQGCGKRNRKQAGMEGGEEDRNCCAAGQIYKNVVEKTRGMW